MKANVFCAWSTAALIVLQFGGVTVQAATAESPQTIKGRVPIASNVVLNNQSNPGNNARVGNTASVAYNFVDQDGDANSGTSIQWRRNGSAISGANGTTYTTQSADNNSTLSVMVVPQTNPSITEPSVGAGVISSGLAVVNTSVNFGRFLAPDRVRVVYDQAVVNCQNKGARVPTGSEMIQLFNTATSGVDFNIEMCTKYGWMVGSNCGGDAGYSNGYWTSDVSTVYTPGRKTHTLTRPGLFDAASDNTVAMFVACYR